MKKFLLFLLITSSLFSETFFTLDNVKDLRIYMSSSTNFLNKDKQATIKERVKDRLQKAGFIFGKNDATTFMLKVEAIEILDTNAIYVEIGLGEEVKTLRDGDVYSFAFTYLANDFIDSQEPYKDTLESIDFLLSQFIEAHKIDNE